MSWSTVSPDIGMITREYDPTSKQALVELPIPNGNYDPEQSRLFLRNTLGVMGVACASADISISSAQAVLTAQTPIAEQLLHDVTTKEFMRRDGMASVDPAKERSLNVGQIVDMSRFRSVSHEELQFAKEYGDIVIGGEHVLREGGFRIRLSDVQTILRASKLQGEGLKAQQNRSTMLIHGRAGTQHFTQQRNPNTESSADETVQQHFNGTASFSLGPYTGVIQERSYTQNADGTFTELPWQNISGSGLVEKFALGLLNRHNKGVFMHADSHEFGLPSLRPEDIWVDVDVFQPYSSEGASSNFFKDWADLTPEAKLRLHQQGADLVEVLQLQDPAVLGSLFTYNRLNATEQTLGIEQKNYFANVLSPNGITPIGVLHQEREFAKTELVDGVRLEGRYRDLPKEYGDLAEQTGNLGQATPEGARVVVIDTLPDAHMINVLYQEGVRGVVFKDLSDEGPYTGGAALNNTMRELSKAGMQFIQKNDNDVLRVYHGRQMVKYDKLEAFRKVNFRVVNYGTASEGRMQHEPEMKQYLIEMVAFLRGLGIENIVFEDGGGPASMRASSEAAKQAGVMTSGVAIFAEAVDGQAARVKDYDAYWMYPVRDLAPRQSELVLSPTVVQRHKGGIGTLSEGLDDTLAMQLLEKLPIPMFAIDLQKSFDDYDALIHKLSTADESGKYLAMPWVRKLAVTSNSYTESLAQFKEILPNLKPLWREMLALGMKAEDFRGAVTNNAHNLQERGVLPHHDYIMNQVYEFLAELEAQGK